MDREYLKKIVLYSPRSGKFYWIKPPPTHSELLGEEAGSVVTNASGKKYHMIQIDGVKHKRSRLAFMYLDGKWPSAQVDHINGDSLDDRWQNLRDATSTQNNWNHKKRARRLNLPMGVRTTPGGRFSARIGYMGQQITLGTFDSPKEAEDSYKKARQKYYGEYA